VTRSLARSLIVATLFIGAGPAEAAASRHLEGPAPLTPAQLQRTHRFALVIGVNDGGRDRPRLRYAGSDAKALSKVLAELGGVAAQDRLILDDPDVDELRGGFASIAKKAQAARSRNERVELLFYYSGHSDETGLLIGDKLVSYRWLREKIDALPADVRIAILDSCASGAFTRLKGGKKREPFLVREPSVKGHAFLTSTSADEAAQESERIRGSFFTHYLVTGLRGAADINQDHVVTLNEAYQFAFDETLARTEGTRGGPQHAAYEIQLAGSGDLVMTDLRTSTATIELAADIGGRVFIRDAQGNLEAELHKPKGAGTVALALEPGVYRITVDDGGKVWRASVRVAEGEAALLEAKGLQVLPAESTTLRGDAQSPAPPTGPELFRVVANVGVSPKYSTNAKYGARPLVNNFSVSFGYNQVAAVEGLDMSLGATTVTDHLHGVQLAVGMANTEGRARGVQASAILSLATGDFRGHQWSTLVNVATKNLHGSQMGTGVNYARDLRGFQAGLVNVGRGRTSGLQLGLVNYADDADVSIGLVPISREGGVHADVWTSDLAAINVGLRFSARRSYTLLTAGVHPSGPGAGWMAGFGLGRRFHVGGQAVVDFDNLVMAAQAGFQQPGKPTLVDSLRLMIGWQPHKHFSLFGGPTFNVAVALNELYTRPGYNYTFYQRGIVSLWPGFSFGISL